jgi:uncharacterized protein (DUF58 family)
MIRWFRDSGFVQAYTALGLFTGFMATAFGEWIFAFFILGLALFLMVIMTIKNAMKLSAKLPDKPIQQLFLTVGIFYCVIYGYLLFAFLFGLIQGAR